ncbi:MAG: hypothetical protein IJ565_01765 [Bacilli bacterium]|nr:hypothetical protein [Bacilli bacterium]
MKKLIVGVIVVVAVFWIYNAFKDDKVYYVSISDKTSIDPNINYGYKNHIEDYLSELDILEKYVDIYNENDRITDIIRNIDDNKKYDNKTFKNILIKADILTLSIGYNDIISKLDKYSDYEIYKYIDTYINDLENLYKLLREYDKEDIIMIGYYNPYDNSYDNTINYINKRVKDLCNDYKINYIDISDMKEYIDNGYIIIEGQHIIFDKLRSIVDDNISNK